MSTFRKGQIVSWMGVSKAVVVSGRSYPLYDGNYDYIDVKFLEGPDEGRSLHIREMELEKVDERKSRKKAKK